MPHWRDFTNSTLLGAYSCYSDKEDRFIEKNGTIIRCEIQEHTLGGSGKTRCLVGVTDFGKPIKINIVAISSVLQEITGTRNPDKWVNVPVTFYVDENVKFGKQTVEAIRIKRQINAPKIDYTEQINKVYQCEDLNALIELYKSFNTLEQIATQKAKDEMKLKFDVK